MVCPRSVVTAAVMRKQIASSSQCKCQSVWDPSILDTRRYDTYLSGVNGPTNTLPAFCTSFTRSLASCKCMIKCSGAYSFENTIASSGEVVCTIKLFATLCRRMSTRGSARACASTSASIAVTASSDRLTVTRTTWESIPCSAWERRSAATKAGLAVESAMTCQDNGPGEG